MVEETAYNNGRISNFQGLVTLTLDRVILHTIVHHSSTSTYIPNFIEIEKISCWLTYVRTYTYVWTDGHLRPTLLGRIKRVDLQMTDDNDKGNNFPGWLIDWVKVLRPTRHKIDKTYATVTDCEQTGCCLWTTANSGTTATLCEEPCQTHLCTPDTDTLLLHFTHDVVAVVQDKRDGCKKEKGKEAYLYSAFYILRISQSAQAWITQF